MTRYHVNGSKPAADSIIALTKENGCELGRSNYYRVTRSMDQLSNKAAEIALRLAALPPGRRPDTATLDALEQLAVDLLSQVSAARLGESAPSTGEIRGYWPAYQRRRQ